MVHGSQSRTPVRLTIRHLVLVVAIAGSCSLQGCATSIETLGLGVGIGVAGAFGLLTCALSCH